MYYFNHRYALCISPRFIKMFKGLYGYNKDENLTRDQRAMLFTSMAVQPESLMLKVCNKIFSRA